MLIIFAGLPGVGKTSIARELARDIGAVYLRIDSIEDAMRSGGAQALDGRGYRVAYAVAEDNLRIGRIVIADSVNPFQLTRDAWVEVAHRAHAGAAEIEVVCSDVEEHRRRVEARAGSTVTWADVVSREYHPWGRDRLVVDTARRSVERSVAVICAYLGLAVNQ